MALGARPQVHLLQSTCTICRHISITEISLHVTHLSHRKHSIAHTFFITCLKKCLWNTSSVSPACRKRRLILEVSRKSKKDGHVSALEGHVKEPYNNIGVGSRTVGPTSSVRLHICAVTYITIVACVTDSFLSEIYNQHRCWAGHNIYL